MAKKASDKAAKSASYAPYESDLAFVGDALAYLRLRCQMEIARREATGLIPKDPVAAISGNELDPVAIDAAIDEVAARMQGRLDASETPPVLYQLQQRFELDDFERDVLLMALAPAIDGTFDGAYGRIKGLTYRAGLDVDVVLAVLVGDDMAERVQRRHSFSPKGRLLAHNLLMLGRGAPDAGDDFLNLQVKLPARLVTLLLGQPGDDETLQSFSSLIEPVETLDRVILPPYDMQRIVSLVARHDRYLASLERWGLNEAIPYGRGVVMLFSGPSGTGKTLTARAVANHLGRRLLLVDTNRLSDNQRSFEANVDNLLREAKLQNAVLFFDECEALFAAAHRATGKLSALLSGIERFDGVVVMATNVPGTLDKALDRRVLYRVNFEMPTPTMREAIWKVHLPESMPLADDVDIAYLGRRFEFAGGYIKNAVLLAASEAAARGDEAVVTQNDLMRAAYTQLRSRLNRYADKEVADLRLEDLILPEDIKDQVSEIIEAVAAQQIVFREWGFGRKFNKGRGLSALFDGEPGTGKTLSAEVISAELGMNLFRVNVANIVSKYIGETEKNLTKVFAEARSASSILLFDEADSLFAKRVEVKHSNDRFANMNTGVLLQLIERYDGLVILTTNLKTSIDPAFERRLSFKINFPFPEEETRAVIWEHMIPDMAPVEDDIDYELLGKCYELSGGSIKNAVLRAAYRAAAQGTKIGMRHFDDAAKRECQAAGKLYRVASSDDFW